MQLLKIFMGFLLFGFVAGFIWLAFMDVPITKSTVTKTISNERFFVKES